MTGESKFTDRYYLAIIASLVLSAILPMFYRNTYDSTGAELTSESVSLISFPPWAVVVLGLYAVFGLLLAVSYFLVVKKPTKNFDSLEWIPPKSFITLPLLGLFAIFYYIDVKIRLPIVIDAYVDEVAFGQVADAGFGYYFLFLTSILTFGLFFVDFSKTTEEGMESVKSKIKSLPELKRHPLVIQYLTFHVGMLLFMMISYSMYFNDPQFWNGIPYYTELFYYYGMNGRFDSIPDSYYWSAWILLPVAVVTVCSFFFISSGSGFAPNGAPLDVAAPENEYADTEISNFVEWGFFNKDVPFADIWFGSAKMNMFYISLFITVVVLLAVGAYLARKFGYEVKHDRLYHMMAFVGLLIWWYAYNFATISAPVFILWGGMIESTLFDRGYNRFIIYRFVQTGTADFGYYHPLSTFWIAFFFSIPLVILARGLIYIFKVRNKGTKDELNPASN